MNPMTNAHRLYSEFGQSVWLDYFDPSLLANGGLDVLELDGVRGAINSPSVFCNAIARGNTYDDAIVDLIQSDATIDNETIYQWLLANYAATAADILRPVYESSGGNDGFINVELPAHLANDAQATIEEARHLWNRIKRNNLMIKIPATPQGIEAMETLIGAGINVNMTHLYILEDYKAVVRSYLRGLAHSEQPSKVHSVASYFLDPLDEEIDRALDELGITEVQVVKGKTAVAGAKVAYQYYQEILHSNDFMLLHERGASMQRLLWADISPTNSQYEKTFYADQLIGSQTICAMSPATFDAFLSKGNLLHSLDSGMEAAQRIPMVLESLEIDLPSIAAQLLGDGVRKIANSHRMIFTALEKKRLQLTKEFA